MRFKVSNALELGWSIVPVKLDKKPYIKWTKYQTSKPDRDILTRWHKEFDPPAWAVVTGAVSGIVVIDFDGEAGRQLVKELGVRPHVQTGSGGYHLYLKHPGFEVKTLNSKSSRELGNRYPGLDIRADGGYAIFYGENSSGKYTWLRDPEPDPISELPPDLMLLLGLESEASPAIDSQKSAERLLKWALKCSAHGRNDAGFALACQLRDNSFSKAEAESVMREYQSKTADVNQKGEPEPYTVESALASLDQAYSRPPREEREPSDSDDEQDEDRKGRSSQAAMLLEIALGLISSLFCTPEGEAYVVLPVNCVAQVHQANSKTFKDILRYSYYKKHKELPRTDNLKNVVEQIGAESVMSGNIRETHVRLAKHEQAIYLDLANEQWQAVRIDANGWEVVSDPPVAFRRGPGTQPLPIPVKGGDINLLREFVNVSDEQFVLLAAFLIGVLQVDAPFPVLVISGEQGSAKSTATRLIKDLIDPNAVPLKIRPKSDRDVLITAANNWLIAYDNISYINEWLSDVIAALATGVGYSTRELWTNHGEAILTAKRPLVLNGIGDIVNRSDLLDRSILLTLAPIPEENRMAVTEFWTRFQAAKPAILGALLDCVSAAMRNLPHTKLEKLPRMADFALWSTAAEAALPWPQGTFIQAYANNRESAHYLVLAGNPVADRLQELMANRSRWVGKMSDLYSQLRPNFPPDGFPKDATRLGQQLRRIAPNLRHIGIDISIRHTEAGNIVTVTRVAASSTYIAEPEPAEATEAIGVIGDTAPRKLLQPQLSLSEDEPNTQTASAGSVDSADHQDF